ncbi:MAG: exodeoxyribonuclease VII large subunit [Pirellulales bacterium]|nr:exodeoxyribonuclease VII large subunit [Pirellulales bacterium]
MSPTPVLTVSALTTLLKEVVETTFPEVWVSGELTNCSAAGSGHWYLSLKDDSAQMKAVIWRSTAAKLKFQPEDGLAVIARGYLDLYIPRGTYQLVIEELHPRGVGTAELALRRLKEKLAREGLFDPARKRELPSFPRRIGIVTSPTGAVVKDFLEVLRRRWRLADVLILPARVQGEEAPREIAAAIRRASALLPPLDVLVVARGGGSSEDLQAFNAEEVVRAMAAVPCPVVSAVGHEIDVTLADLVADVRALTPSEAAERVVPSLAELRQQLAKLGTRYQASLAWRAEQARRRLDQLANRLPFRRPYERIWQWSQQLDQWQTAATRQIRQIMTNHTTLLASRAVQLEALSPLRVLGRGYSLTRRGEDGMLLSAASEVRLGMEIITRLANGEISSTVTQILPENPSRTV